MTRSDGGRRQLRQDLERKMRAKEKRLMEASKKEPRVKSRLPGEVRMRADLPFFPSGGALA